MTRPTVTSRPPSTVLQQRPAATEGVQTVKQGTPAPKLTAVSLHEVFQKDPARAEKLLDAYYGGYQKAFPDPDELTSKSELRTDLKDPEACHWDVTLFADKDGKVVAGAHTNVLETKEGKFGVIEYLWTDESARRGGVGTAAHDGAVKKMQQQSGGELKGVFMEVNDPRLMTPAEKDRDAIRPEDRLKFWGDHVGYRALDALYIQPPLDAESKAVNTLMPVYKPLGEGVQSMSRETYRDLVKSYFETWVDGPVEKDPSFRAISASLTSPEIRLVPLQAARESVADRFVAAGQAPVTDQPRDQEASFKAFADRSRTGSIGY
jgi:hypothetical protein